MSSRSTSETGSLSDRLGLSGVGVRRALLYATLAAMLAFFLTPIESGLMTSFKTTSAISSTAPYAPPGFEAFTTEKWETALDVLLRGVINSMMFAIPATVLSAGFASFAAYGLTQIDWRGQIPILALFVAGIFIPYQAVLVPLNSFWSTYVSVEELFAFLWTLPYLTPDHAGIIELIVTHTAYGIPICTILFRGYYQAMSSEMIESARLDGASIATVYWRIVLPLSTPMFAVTLIYQFTQIWNELLFALVLVSSSSSSAAPVTLILAGLGESLSGVDFALRMAGAFIAALPTLIVYIMFGDEFAEGVAA